MNSLRSPDLVTLEEEAQDNNGPVNDGTTNADQTLNTLVSAIQAAGGPTYQYRYISPVNNQDGGEPGGNIRVAFLYRTDRGLEFVAGTQGGATQANSVVVGGEGGTGSRTWRSTPDGSRRRTAPGTRAGSRSRASSASMTRRSS